MYCVSCLARELVIFLLTMIYAGISCLFLGLAGGWNELGGAEGHGMDVKDGDGRDAMTRDGMGIECKVAQGTVIAVTRRVEMAKTV